MKPMFAALTDQATGVVNVAKSVAEQSDRVLFILCAAGGAAMTIWMLRTFMKYVEEKDKQLRDLQKDSNESLKQVAASMDRVNDTLRENTETMKMIKTKCLATVLLLVSLACFAGCSKFSGYSERTFDPDGNVMSERVHMRAYTIFDGTNVLSKVKALQTKATLSVGADGVSQESSGKSVVDAIEKVGDAIPKAINKAILP